MEQNSQPNQIPQILSPSHYMRDDSYDVGERRQLAIPAFLSLLRDAKAATSAQRIFDIEMSKIDEKDVRDLITEILEEFPHNVLRPGEELVRLASARRKLEQKAEMKREAEEKRKDEAREKRLKSIEWLRDQWAGRSGSLESDSTEPTPGSKDSIDEA
ncbi:hypothetical protein FVEN_g1040 [Fusarium venenatum]|uniref:Uncharacterized protein n=1 Tax=Fusarium venenatum TaxID=56646 RepID=A0A2L2TPK0_9HYPO|nr:uncharacterized protein FVRRES_10530 [Fusarium venenatum]KAG8361602.1 hypothetical protein FVEN_g1040 [Fusarium venenatum]CEI70453.1 unnamed protein product [Fusarium venenatum]